MAALVVAHRGASAGAVDNSLDAFERAIDLGADLLEFDVRRTRDDQLIAFHDAAVGGRPVATLTRAEIGAGAGHLPPLLDEVLDLARGRIGLDVELKEDGYVARVLAALDGLPDVVVTSFLDDVVAEAKRLAPELRAGLLVGVGRTKQVVKTRLSELSPVPRATACGADLVAMHHALASLGALRRVAEAGFPVFVWTVNDEALLRRFLADPRVEAVITDVPGRALSLRDA
jgi:glycerophosphoryl diester phosphodiesterase